MSACGKRLPFLPQISRFFIQTDDMPNFRRDSRFKPFDVTQIEKESKIRHIMCVFEDPPDEQMLTYILTLRVDLAFVTPPDPLASGFYSVMYPTPLYPQSITIWRPVPHFANISKIKVYTRFDKYFYEVYQTIKPTLDKLPIPHEFRGTYFGANTVSRLDDNTLYIFLSAPEVKVPAKGHNSPVVLWYFEQPKSGYVNTDRDNGWFDFPEILMSPWPKMQEDFFRERPLRHSLYIPYTYDPILTKLSDDADKNIDIFFCGCPNTRRQQLQEKLKSMPYDFYFTNDAFGEKLDEFIRRSKIVLNLHYYPEALLEIHRINRMLAYNVCVVSEHSADKDTDIEYSKYVDFCDIDAMPAYLDKMLRDDTWVEKSQRAVAFRQDKLGAEEMGRVLHKMLTN